METLELRYNNFKAFCQKMQPDNELVKMLQITPLGTFLQTIQIRQKQNSSTTEIRKMILEKGQIDEEKVDKADLEKFDRYIQYFNDVISTLE